MEKNHDESLEELEENLRKEEEKSKKIDMPMSGKSVFRLKEIIEKRRKEQKRDR